MASSWLAERIRLTVFRYPGTDFDAGAAWSVFAGHDPEETSRKPAIGSSSANGPFGAGRLVIDSDPVRVHFIYAPTPPNESAIALDLGPMDEHVGLFVNSADKWLAIAPPSLRIAFGLVLVRPVSARREGYLELVRYLPAVNIDAENSSDFAYQINRPRKLKILDDEKVNRLSKWSVGLLVVDTFAMSASRQGSRRERVAEEHMCRVELDMNTTAERTEPLPQEGILAVFEELVGLAIEVAEKGDTP